MFENLQWDAAQWYATGLTLALAGLVITVQPGLRRIAILLLQQRAPTWVKPGTVLLQAIVLVSGLILIVGWFGTNTIVAVFAVLLLWFLGTSLRRSSRITAALPGLRPHPQPATQNSTAPVHNRNGAPSPLTAPVGELAPAAIPVESKAEPAMAALSSTPTTDTALALMAPLPTDSTPAPAMVTKLKPRRQAVALTPRPTLGKKTTTSLF